MTEEPVKYQVLGEQILEQKTQEFVNYCQAHEDKLEPFVAYFGLFAFYRAQETGLKEISVNLVDFLDVLLCSEDKRYRINKKALKSKKKVADLLEESFKQLEETRFFKIEPRNSLKKIQITIL